ncbi:hypothetical protein TrispH2_008618 [Trichoplax sp. H2]|nr:hypothetical protein TrispH2_008618 [Trichoplax sp. H2]|eukprot:RDD38995.1 hypothetical protein TrispH2_008618 [Trichoplax sp. H2]
MASYLPHYSAMSRMKVALDQTVHQSIPHPLRTDNHN